MTRFMAVFAVVLSVLMPMKLGAEADGRVQIQREKKAEPGMAGRYLKTILSNIGLRKKPEPEKMSFSRTWVDAQPVAQGDAQWSCLSEALYFEARGETVKGQFAVAEVIMNRVESSRFPGTICGVINQGTGRKFQCQFTYTCNGRKKIIYEKQAYARVAKVARAVIDRLEGTGNLTDGATHYHTTAVRPSWSRTYTKTAQIGVHVFYRQNYRTVQND